MISFSGVLESESVQTKLKEETRFFFFYLAFDFSGRFSWEMRGMGH